MKVYRTAEQISATRIHAQARLSATSELFKLEDRKTFATGAEGVIEFTSTPSLTWLRKQGALLPQRKRKLFRMDTTSPR